MTRLARRTWWPVLMALATAALVFHEDVKAHETTPRDTGIGEICTAGIAMNLGRDASPREALDGRGDGSGWVAPEERCRLPGVPAGLPGNHLITSMTADRKAGIAASEMKAGCTEALEITLGQLELQGWSQTEQSRLARERNADLSVATMIRGDSRLHVIATRGVRSGTATVVAAGFFDEKKRR